MVNVIVAHNVIHTCISIESFIIEILLLKFYYLNFIIEILLFKFYYWNFIIKILLYDNIPYDKK